MATVNELQAQIEALTKLLAQHGIVAPAPAATRPELRGDYIAFGSPQHAAFLGLVEVKKDEDTTDFITHTSHKTGKVYRLEDQVTPFMTFPDPKQVAALVLRQKVSVLDFGPPPVPEDAPPMWRPADDPALALAK